MQQSQVVRDAQQFLQQEDLRGWLIYDYRQSNPIFRQVITPSGHVTRPCFLFVPAMLMVSASEAYAQRIPMIVIWSAGVGLFAPFVAVPVKLGILRLMHLQVRSSRLWFLCAAEWVLWFPVAFIMFRYGRSVAVPLVLPVVLALVVWVHKESVANSSWRSALLLCLPTPILALLLPGLALLLAVLFEDYLPKRVL